MRTIASALALLLGLLAAGCNGELVGGGQRPSRLEVVSGDLQSGTVGEELAQPLVVRVVDDRDEPIANQLVNFVVTAGGGRVFAGSALTNAQGVARERWTLGTVAGDTQRVEARAVDANTGQPLVFAVFRAVATPGAPHGVTAVGAGVRAGSAGTALADSLAARVTDTYGNGVPGATVVWAVPAGGGAVSPAQSITDAQGVARTAWTLGARVDGTQTAEASISPAVRASFTATAGLPIGSALHKVSGDGQNAPVGAQLPTPVAVRLVLPDGRPVQGATITWAVNPGAGSITPPVSITDADGRVQATWMLGTGSGGQVATAGTGTLSALFTANAAPGAPAGLVAVSGGGQTGAVGATLGEQLAVRVTDTHGNPVAGAPVSWNVLRGAGNLSAPQSAAGADGVARVSWALGMRVDSAHAVEATVSGLRVEFWATPGIPSTAALSTESGTGQSGTAGSTLPMPVIVRLRLNDGRGIIGAPVTFSATPNSGSFAPGTAVTDANGRVQATWTLGQQAGTATATVGAPGVASLALSATAAHGAPAAMAVVSGSGQSGSATVALAAPLVVKVTDGFGNPVPGVQVTWSSSVTSGFGPVQSTTDAQGLVQTTWIPRQGGSPTATATAAGGLTAVFNATVAWNPSSVTIAPATGTVLVGDSVRLSATVLSASGEPLVGAPVEWTFAGGSPASIAVNPSGSSAAVVGLTAGHGPDLVRASVYARVEARADTAMLDVRRPRLTSLDDAGRCGFDQHNQVQCPRFFTTERTLAEMPIGRTPATRIGTSVDGVCARVAGNTILCRFGRTGIQEHAYTTGFAPYSATCDLNTGVAYCWGSNRQGELGNGTVDRGTVNQTYPVGPVSGGHLFTTLAVGPVHRCAVKANGDVYCWGSDRSGQLGTNATIESNCGGAACSPTPILVEGGLNATELAAGTSHTCAVTAGGDLYCWGGNAAGQLGTGNNTNAQTPVAVQAGGVKFQAVKAWGSTTCALATDGRIFCWGDNSQGALGNGTLANSNVPVQVSGGFTYKDLGMEEIVSGLTTDGRVFRWGFHTTTPTQVLGQI